MSSEQTTAAPDPVRVAREAVKGFHTATTLTELPPGLSDGERYAYLGARAMQEAMSAQGGGEVGEVATALHGMAGNKALTPYQQSIAKRAADMLDARPAPEVKDAPGAQSPAAIMAATLQALADEGEFVPEPMGGDLVIAGETHDFQDFAAMNGLPAQPTTPAPAAASEGLVERLRREDEQVRHDCEHAPQKVKVFSTLAGEAAARIEADAAEIERKDAALLKAFEYIGGARGTALALAMSGPDNPKLDSGLMKLHDDGLRVEQEVRAALRPAKGGRE